jgi:hypothetical protein
MAMARGSASIGSDGALSRPGRPKPGSRVRGIRVSAPLAAIGAAVVGVSWLGLRSARRSR